MAKNASPKKGRKILKSVHLCGRGVILKIFCKLWDEVRLTLKSESANVFGTVQILTQDVLLVAIVVWAYHSSTPFSRTLILGRF